MNKKSAYTRGAITTNPENQFDFWLGEWDVTWGEDGKGKNHILRIMDDKIIQENFSAPDLIGMSVSSYDAERKLWCQTWVDNNGSYLDFTGGFENEKMILAALPSSAGRPANNAWSGSTSARINLTGTGNAPMTGAKAGVHYGRSSTCVNSHVASNVWGSLYF